MARLLRGKRAGDLLRAADRSAVDRPDTVAAPELPRGRIAGEGSLDGDAEQLRGDPVIELPECDRGRVFLAFLHGGELEAPAGPFVLALLEHVGRRLQRRPLEEPGKRFL